MPSKKLTIWVHAVALLAAGGLTNAWSWQPQLCRRRTQRALTIHFSTSPTQQDDTAVRAGEKGYSLLRRPVDWDPNSDPDFGVPQTLQDESSANDRWKDEAWWSANFEKTKNRAPPDITMDDEDKELDLFQRSWDTLDFEPILRALQDECLTVPARKLVQQAIKVDTPQQEKSKQDERQTNRNSSLMATTVEGCQERYRAVHELRTLLTSSKTFRNRNGKQAPLSVFPLAGHSLNLAPLLEDTTRLLEGPDLYDILSVLNVMEDFILWNQELKEQHAELEHLNRMASSITLNTTFHELLQNALDDKGRLSGTTFPAVGRLRARLRALKSDILLRLETLLKTPSVKAKLSLQSGGPLYSQVSGGRLVIPVETSSANKIGIVHDSSRSGQTSYVEPTEIVGPTNELKQVESELRAEEARIWRSLTAQVQLNREGLELSIQAMAQLDLVMARLRLGESWEGTIPVVEDNGVISLRNAKHPVLLLKAMRKRKKSKLSILSTKSGGNQEDMNDAMDEVVGSDIDLGGRHQGLVLTGPNSGGKTIILKMLGLAALMARSGIPIPCEDDSPRVDFFDPILADIGDLQSVGGDLSTFSGHMLVCKAVLDQAGKNALVLMDEVGSGTDPAQGVAIAQALLEALLETGSRVAITTHYTQLKQLAVADERFAVAGMQFVRGRPTYKLLPGTVGESFALSVAERVGLPLSVLERANELLDSETRQMGDLIRELEDQKATLEEQAAELEEKKREIEQIQFKLKEENLRLEKKMLNVRREEAKAFTKKLEEKEQVLEEILRKLKSDPSGKVVAKSWQDIKFVKRDALNEAENVPSVIARKEAEIKEMNEASADLVPLIEMRDKPNLIPGDKLIVCKKGAMFGREASFIKSLSGRVEVSVNGMNVSFKLAEVALPPSATTRIAKYNKSRGPQKGSQSSISKAAERALDIESTSSGGNAKVKAQTPPEPVRSAVAIRTQSNTIDVRGCTLEQAKSKAESAFSSCLMSNRSVVYILHGYGTGGILRNKVRNWLKTSSAVKEWAPASAEDGGDAFTRVVLR
ncbi:DNA mismatch repair protein MutS2 [Fistulifera solaris]|uniref:DNA mismatch repair protein MutS2 n=1 Tax=Fistulifera solaris TaxID=1519565 RepID=A0A1Z5KRL6_FISSO|nr:DNA mismatch repair protein MutS2 [Fistulifera solaris]|eukprot:GAX28752.1 DNA mismatch repair protein MutS2 [Fistulifera solaris]